MQLQLTFDYPYNITQDYFEPNSIEIIFWNSTLFTGASDGRKLPSGTKVKENLPKFINPSIQSALSAIGEAVSEAGVKSLSILFLLNFFIKFGMNQVLSKVRNQAMIVHFMILQLNYAVVSSFYFGYMIEFVNFDLLQMQEVHAYFFGFYNVPWSAQAEFIGYESRFFIENTGSLLYVYLLLMLLQLIIVMVLRAFASTTKVHKIAK